MNLEVKVTIFLGINRHSLSCDDDRLSCFLEAGNFVLNLGLLPALPHSGISHARVETDSPGLGNVADLQPHPAAALPILLTLPEMRNPGLSFGAAVSRK
jgi:hypothetical protein